MPRLRADFGVQHLSMLGGLVFFSHQIGSFMGVWLGGYLYDSTGSYDIVWYIAIALGVLAGLVNLPIREHPCSAGAATGLTMSTHHTPHRHSANAAAGWPGAGRAGAAGGVCALRPARLHGDAGRPGVGLF